MLISKLSIYGAVCSLTAFRTHTVAIIIEKLWCHTLDQSPVIFHSYVCILWLIITSSIVDWITNQVPDNFSTKSFNFDTIFAFTRCRCKQVAEYKICELYLNTASFNTFDWWCIEPCIRMTYKLFVTMETRCANVILVRAREYGLWMSELSPTNTAMLRVKLNIIRLETICFAWFPWTSTSENRVIIYLCDSYTHYMNVSCVKGWR